jgi:basic membrane protein A
VLAVAMSAATLAACGSDNKSSSGNASTTGGASTQPAKKKGGKVMYLTLAPVTSGNWEPLNFAAFQKSMSKYGLTFAKQEGLTIDDAASVLRRVAPDYNLVVLDSAGFDQPLLEVASQFPDTKFAVVSDLATTGGNKNVSGWAFNWNQYGYLAGTVACMAANGGKIGHVNSIPIPAFTRWAAGAKQAAGDYCGGTSNYLVSWTNTFTDPAKSKQAALSLMSKGASVLMSSTDTADDGTREAVKAQGKKYLGAYADESAKLPCCTITSVEIDFDRAYDEIGRDFTSGHFGKITSLNVANGGIKLVTPFKAGDAALEDKVKAVEQKIKDGTITIDPKATVKP